MENNNIEPSYRAPSARELIQDGYYNRYVTYDATNEIIAYLTSSRSIFKPYIDLYLKNNSNSIVHPTRMAISVIAYGTNNVHQFGNTLDNAIYQSAIRLIRHVFVALKRKGLMPDRLVRFSNARFIELGNVIYSSCKIDIDMIAIRMSLTYIPYKAEPTSWYKKLCN